jgi:predicted dehydrogenase
MSSRKYRIGVIGSTKRGDYGHGLDVAWFEHPNAEIVAVADDDKGGLAAAAAKLKTSNAFSDWRKMLAEAKPDVVAVCPRWVDQHRDMTLAAAERGVHVYMEKPFCRTLEEADQLIAAAEMQNGEPIRASDVVQGAEGLGPLAGDQVSARYGLADGATAFIASKRNAAGRPSRYGLQIVGSGGVIDLVEGTMPAVKCLPSGGWNLGRNEPKWQDVSTAGIGKPEPLTDAKYRSRHYLAIADLFEAIENDRPPKCSAAAARDVMQMIFAVFESQRVGGPVELPLTNRKHPLTML